jgi:hypothetical protein
MMHVMHLVRLGVIYRITQYLAAASKTCATLATTNVWGSHVREADGYRQDRDTQLTGARHSSGLMFVAMHAK